jgi:hypothetical protein
LLYSLQSSTKLPVLVIIQPESLIWKKILRLIFLIIFLLCVQVAGATGRIVVSDFWDYDGHDTFQLESFRHA